MKDQLKFLALADIDESATNPRTRFDNDSIKELAESIKQVGLIQAITVRPKENKRFELVAGARRFRASQIAETGTIMAMVRELSDDQVLEIQLIENLDRRDVHPLEEAAHFKKMLDTGNYTIQEIAHRIAKAESFVAHRLKLNDLVPEVQEDFFNAELSIGQAALIARITPEAQQELRTGYKDNGRVGYGTTKDLEKEIQQELLSLTGAPFKLDQGYFDLPICKVCPNNTGNNPMLFAELQGNDSCTNKACFRQKGDYQVGNDLAEISYKDKKPALAIRFNGKPSPENIAHAKDYKLTVLREFDDFKLEQNYRFSEPIDIYWIDGDKKATYGTAYKTKDAAADAVSSAPVASGAALSQADKLREAESKLQTLDAQKVHTTLVDALKSEFEKRRPQPFEMESDFADAMLVYLAMLNNSFYYLVTDLINLGVVINPEYKTLQDLETDLKALTPEQKIQMAAAMLYRQCSKTTDPSGIHGQIIRRLAQQHTAIDLDKIQAQQDTIAAGRKAEMETKINKLEGKK